MKELLYKKSEAVAALNRVDGFHPMELARKIGEEGQEEQLYLDVKYRKLWFRLVNPAGKIISRIITFTENMAVVEARIYLDKCDQEDNYVANSFSQKFRSDDPKFGDKFLEMAETAASMSHSMKLIIEDIDYCLAKMADGNYAITSKHPDKYVGEYAGIIAALRQMNHQMNDTLRKINDASGQVSAGSGNLAEAAQSLAEGATDQSASVQELQATIANIAEGVAKTSQNTEASYQQASKYAEEADTSRGEMESMMNAMNRINETSQNIGNIISEIEDIASQTNLLSLNASIEAQEMPAGDLLLWQTRSVSWQSRVRSQL